MRGINKMILIGRLGSDPEIRYSADGKPVVTLSLATNEGWMDRSSGEWQERVEWHSVLLFNKPAEVAAEYLKRGSLAYIEGRLQTQQWTDKSGNSRTKTQIVARRLEMLGKIREEFGGDDIPWDEEGELEIDVAF